MKARRTARDRTSIFQEVEAGLAHLRAILEMRLQAFSGVDLRAEELEDRMKQLAGLEILPGEPFGAEENVVLLAAIAPHVQPSLFEDCVYSVVKDAGEYPTLGFARGQSFRGFLATGESVMFLLGAANAESRARALRLFDAEHPFRHRNVLELAAVAPGEPELAGRLVASAETVSVLTTAHSHQPRFGSDFPAARLVTEREWSDLVLHRQTRAEIDELLQWLDHRETLLDDWEMGRIFDAGYKVMLYGSPGTGKTLTAAVLGKAAEKEIYRIDLSMVISKFIGETEKNLERVFVRAENRGWILFFDEADALFGARTGVRDAHDRYANQEVSYLLQRVEQYPGLVILATNFKNNIDDAFLRRFQSVIHFPRPGPIERRTLFEKRIPAQVSLAPDVEFDSIARAHDLTGSNIDNVMRAALLKTIVRGDRTLRADDLLAAIRKELDKEGRSD